MRRFRWWFLALVTLSIVAEAHRTWGYTPESPRVRRMVSRAVKFLAQQDDSRLGGQCLIALALYKAGRPKSDPIIQKALERCREECRPGQLEYKTENKLSSLYGYAIATIFLCEVDPQDFQSEIDTLTRSLVQWQKPNGSWGYRERSTGDTSQTQYVILALWTAKNVGVHVPERSFTKACNWLIRVQDPKGSWAYQGIEPTGSRDRVRQTNYGETKHSSPHSMTAAALGALYICIDALDLRQLDLPAVGKVNFELPPAIRIVKSEARDSGPPRVSLQRLSRAVADGNQWFSESFRIDPKTLYLHYYHYSFERYASFREKFEETADPEPPWYNQGVEFLADRQEASGAFRDDASRYAGKETSTAFAVLFLTRSTQKTIGKFAEGKLKAGRGLPSNASDIRLRGGRIVSTPISRTVGDLLGILEEPDWEDELKDLLNSSVQLEFSGNALTQAEQAAQLRMLVSHRSYEARLIAVRKLARSRNLDNVPALIYALSDPDVRVVRAARDGLRRISRKFQGFGLPDTPTGRQVQQAQAMWKQWYQLIRPDASIEELFEQLAGGSRP